MKRSTLLSLPLQLVFPALRDLLLLKERPLSQILLDQGESEIMV
jgi:hypothetical protein